MMIRSPSVSMSTRDPSRRPARIAMSLGMRSPRLLPQRETCTCIGIPQSASRIYMGYRRATRKWGGGPGRFRNLDQCVDLARLADAAQLVMAERQEASAVAEHGGELGRHKHLAVQWLAQGLDAGHLVDRRTDHREVEAVDRADITVQHLAQME